MKTNDSACCVTCKKDLASCRTIFAAEGMLFCSRECGILKYSINAMNWFDVIAEELTPAAIGLEVHDDEVH